MPSSVGFGSTESVPPTLVLLLGTWWMHNGDEGSAETWFARLVGQKLLQVANLEPRFIPFVPEYRGTLMVHRASSALDHLYLEVPGLREGKVLLPAVAWSAGLEIARIMERLHGRQLWSVVGSVAGLPRTGVGYREFVGFVWNRFAMIVWGLIRNSLTLTPRSIAEDVLGLTEEEASSFPLARCLQLLQRPETFRYVASAFIPVVKELCAAPPLCGELVPVLFEQDPFVGPQTKYPGERVLSFYVVPGAHGAFFRAEMNPSVAEGMQRWGAHFFQAYQMVKIR